MNNLNIIILSLTENPPIYQDLINHGYTPILFRGYKRSDISDKELLKYYNTNFKILTAGCIGCGYSHIKIWEYIVNYTDNLSDEPYFLIFEEDVVTKKSLRNSINIILQITNVKNNLLKLNNIDIFYPGYSLAKEMKHFTTFSLKSNCLLKIYMTKFVVGFHSHILNQKSARLLVDAIKENKILGHIDEQVLNICNALQLRLCVVDEDHKLFTQTSGNLNIYNILSNNVSNDVHPILLTYFLSKINITEECNLAYSMKLSTFEIYGYPVTKLLLFWISVGFLIGFYGLNLTQSSLLFIIFHIPDLLFSKLSMSISYRIFIEYLFFIVLCYIGNLKNK